MKKYLFAAAMIAMTSPALAGSNQSVPEMSAGAGVAAIALLAGAAAIIRERMKK